MPAYLLLVVAILSRLVPHAGLWNFTAVGGALLYFGARRSTAEMLAPLTALVATDYALTTAVYHYSFQWTAYIPTWCWYLMAMALGRILLASRTTIVRTVAATVLGPTSFFIISNYAMWLTSGMYPYSPAGLTTCYVAALPFYGRDLLSTALVVVLAFVVPALVRHELRQPVAVSVRK